MTIAIGFTCSDALLICADTQLTVAGITKLHGSKIFREEYPNGAKSAIAIAGTLSYARMTMQHIEQRIGDLATTDATLAKFRHEIEDEIWELHDRHFRPDRYGYGQSVFLIAMVWSPVDSRSHIFWTEGATVSELRGYQALGSGADLAHYVIQNEGYAATMSESQVRPIAIKAIAKAKDYADGCGGFTELIRLGNDGILGTRERIAVGFTP